MSPEQVSLRIGELQSELTSRVGQRAATVSRMGQIEVLMGELDRLLGSLAEVRSEMVFVRAKVQGLALDVTGAWYGDHRARCESECGLAEEDCTRRVVALDGAVTRLRVRRAGLTAEWDGLSGQRSGHGNRISAIDAELARLRRL